MEYTYILKRLPDREDGTVSFSWNPKLPEMPEGTIQLSLGRYKLPDGTILFNPGRPHALITWDWDHLRKEAAKLEVGEEKEYIENI